MPKARLWQAKTLDKWLLEPEVIKPWLIKGLIPTDSMILLSGQQKLTNKTYMSLVIAFAIATGKGISLIQPPDKTRRHVLFIEEEGAAFETKQRVRAICRAMAIDEAELDHVHWVFREGVKLDDEQWKQKLIVEVQEVKPVLIVLDAMYALHSGDENKVNEMQHVFDTMQTLRREGQGSSILYLAHLGKAQGWSRNSDIDQQVRGSSSAVNLYDVHIAPRRYTDEEPVIDMRVRFRGQGGKRYLVGWDFETREDVNGNDMTWKASISMREHGSPIDMLQRCKDVLENEIEYTTKDMQAAWGVGTKVAREIKERLIEERWIKRVVEGEDRWMINKSNGKEIEVKYLIDNKEEIVLGAESGEENDTTN